jgi:hypothetical protein
MRAKSLQNVYLLCRIVSVILAMITGVAVLYARVVAVEINLGIVDRKVDRLCEKMEAWYASGRARPDAGSPHTTASRGAEAR